MPRFRQRCETAWAFAVWGTLLIGLALPYTAADVRGELPAETRADSAGTARPEPPVSLVAGSAVAWQHPAYESPLELWLPENYSADADRSAPLILYFHGTSGRPTTRLMRHYTGDRDFVIVGMTYLQSGQFQYDAQGLEREISAYRRVVADLLRFVHFDEQRIYVAGFSKGGWLSALFLEKDRQLAGGMVMGGGVFNRSDELTEPFGSAKPIYVGIGALDGNLAMSYKARHHFSALQARVTLDVWPDLGHRYPLDEHESLALRQWLRVEACKNDAALEAGLRDDAIEWFEEELRRIRKLDGMVDRYLALVDLAAAPYAGLVDDAARQRAREVLQEVRADKAVATEVEVQARYLEILDEEFIDLGVERLATCASAYQSLWQQYPRTHFGDLARQSYERTQQLLRSVPAKP